MKTGFDNEKYLKIQSEQIKKRIAQFGDKLYLEFGGKLFDDNHASRVLPGFQPDSKLQMLMQLKDESEIIIVISAIDIEKNKVRGDLGITYDEDVLRLREEFENVGLFVSSVVITHYNGQSSADAYRRRLERLNIKVYYHYTIEGYPNNVSLIDSDEGFGKNDYVETSRPLVIVTAPGPGSGKMAVCLSQLYHENFKAINIAYGEYLDTLGHCKYKLPYNWTVDTDPKLWVNNSKDCWDGGDSSQGTVCPCREVDENGKPISGCTCEG